MLNTSKNMLNLFDIIWEDILFEYVLPSLSIKDLFNLRCCSRLSKEFVECGLEKIKVIDFSGNNSKHINLAFSVLADICYNIKELNLAKCNWITDSLLIKLLNKNANLNSLNLSDCSNISAPSLQPVIINCKGLKILNLSNCYWVTIGALEALILHHKKLENINLTRCVVNTRTLILLIHKFTELQVFSLAYIHSVNDNVLLTISEKCLNMKHLCLIGCKEITDVGIKLVAANCSKLESLMVRGCPLVTEISLNPLRGKIHIDVPCQALQLYNGPVSSNLWRSF